mgnify:CR=1 FL=1|tara:strand:+ start:275 stop:508 length:234 start_codon:yes stop_codon:yes gene_type:complete
MIFTNKEVFNENKSTIDKISAKLGTGPVSLRDYCGGIQVNWVTEGKSYMWRNVDKEDRVEVYTGSSYNTHYLFIDEL